MHDTAMLYGQAFFEAYASGWTGRTIVDIGAQDVNGSLRTVAPPGNTYVGVDFVAGKGVDVVLTDPYTLPFEDGFADACVCSSCLEHSEFFWVLFNEILRVLKPHGVLYLNVPSNGAFHRYPADCWRFYPDSGVALQNWGRRSGFAVVLLESFIGMQRNAIWNDFVGIFLKDDRHVRAYPRRIQDRDVGAMNGIRYGQPGIANFVGPAQDQVASAKLRKILRSINDILADPEDSR